MENTLKNLLSIYIVLWTFSNSLVLFFLNNRSKKVCGISYGKRFYKKWDIIKILQIVLIGWIAFAIVVVYLKCVYGLMVVMFAQLGLLIWMLVLINKKTELSGFKNELVKQERKFKCCLRENYVTTNWNQMMIADVLRCFEFSGEEEQTVIEALQKNIDDVGEKLNVFFRSEKMENVQISMYLHMMDTLLLKDEKFAKRWSLLLHHIVAKQRNQNFRLALVVYLIRNNRVYPRVYLTELLEHTQFEIELLKWALAENYRLYALDVNGWRKNYYVGLRKIASQEMKNNKELQAGSKEVEFMCKLEKTMRRLKNISEITVID